MLFSPQVFTDSSLSDTGFCLIQVNLLAFSLLLGDGEFHSIQSYLIESARTNQLPKPPIKAGITKKKIIRNACPVTISGLTLQSFSPKRYLSKSRPRTTRATFTACGSHFYSLLADLNDFPSYKPESTSK